MYVSETIPPFGIWQQDYQTFVSETQSHSFSDMTYHSVERGKRLVHLLLGGVADEAVAP